MAPAAFWGRTRCQTDASAWKEQGGDYSISPFDVDMVHHKNIRGAFKGAGTSDCL